MKTQEKKLGAQAESERGLEKHERRCFSRVSHMPAALLEADAMASRQEGIASFTSLVPNPALRNKGSMDAQKGNT